MTAKTVCVFCALILCIQSSELNNTDIFKVKQNITKTGTSKQDNVQAILDEEFILMNNINSNEGIFKSTKNISYSGKYATDPNFLEGSGSSDINIVAETIPKTHNCTEPGYDTVCSNKGECVNSNCICSSKQFDIDNITVIYRYSGKYCEECPYCRATRCHKFLPCIECILHEDFDCGQICQFEYSTVSKVRRNIDNDEKICDIEDSHGCFVKFKYYYDAQNVVKVEYEKEPFCFNGFKFVIFTFWGVVGYIFALTLLGPKLCRLSDRCEISKSSTSLSQRCDILRMNLYR